MSEDEWREAAATVASWVAVPVAVGAALVAAHHAPDSDAMEIGAALIIGPLAWLVTAMGLAIAFRLIRGL